MSYLRPVEGRISASFAAHVNRRPTSVNPGTDYAVTRGTPVRAPQSGVVARVRTSLSGSGAAGRFVIIYHDDGFSSDLLHFSRVDVSAGQRVARGQQVGLSGGSANGSESGVGTHVHWSLRTRHVSTLSNAGNIDAETRVGGGNPWSDFRAVQSRLNVWLTFWGLGTLTVDGVFGKRSTAALRDFQARRGLTVDGKLGPQSWAAMNETPVPPVLIPPAPPAPPVVVAPPVVPEPTPEPVEPQPVEPDPTLEPVEPDPGIPEPQPEPVNPAPFPEFPEPTPLEPGQPDPPVQHAAPKPLKGGWVGAIVLAVIAAITAIVSFITAV